MTWSEMEIIEPDIFYHMYNRGINNCSIFQNEQNQLFFCQNYLTI
jgi:L-rhamnose mutarotase